LNKLYRLLKSVTVGVVLILGLIVLSMLSTFVQQGRDLAFYYHTYGSALGWLIVSTGFNQFFNSVPFLVVSGLFFINLAVCCIDRFVSRVSRGARGRYGPDIVHLGLLLLILGGITTALTRQEGQVWMAVGDEVKLTDEISLALTDYRFVQYPNGRPKDWISTVEVSDSAVPTTKSFSIEVNKPLKIADLKVYQASYSTESRADMIDSGGTVYIIRQGQSFRNEKTLMVFAGIEGEHAVFEEWEGHNRKGVIRVPSRGEIGPYTLGNPRIVDVTGLTVADDPGYAPVLLALILITAGLTLTYIQKLGDQKK
jgi:cytochrome c biogenesis protein